MTKELRVSPASFSHPVTTTPAPHPPHEHTWRRRFFMVSVVFLAGSGFWMFQCVSGLLQASSSQITYYDGIRSQKVDGKSLCKHVVSDDFHGAFRELDCLINVLRSLPGKDPGLTGFIRNKFKTLHQRLRKESTDWRTVARWKLLYLMGTRMYPVENQQAESAEIPVYEFNGHHMAVPFWIKEQQKGRDLGPLFHLDTHNDMRAVPSPDDVLKAVENLRKNQNTKDAWHTISHAIYDCAMPVAGGVLTAGYRRVVWGKPSWNGYPEFVNRTFFFGRPHANVPVEVIPSGLSPADRKKAEKRGKELEKKRTHFRLYYDAQLDNPKSPVSKAEAWVQVDTKQRPAKSKFALFTPFTLTILTTDVEFDSKGQGAGRTMFQQLLQSMPKGKFTLDLDLDYFASIDSTAQFKRKAGSDPEWQLDLFAKRRKILKQHLKKFRNLLLALQHHGREPSLITIADSTYLTFAFDEIAEGQSEYTPIEHTAYLRREVRKMFREIYGSRVLGKSMQPKRAAKQVIKQAVSARSVAQTRR